MERQCPNCKKKCNDLTTWLSACEEFLDVLFKCENPECAVNMFEIRYREKDVINITYIKGEEPDG